MTHLMVSVRNLEEALLVRDCGVRWIDVKEPLHGSLGAADPEVWEQIAGAVSFDEAITLSAACGELIEWVAEEDLAQESLTKLEHYSFAKLGLSHCAGRRWPTLWHAWAEQLPAATKPVLVAYADASRANSPSLSELLDFATQTPLGAVLLDTFTKDNGGLLDFLNFDELKSFAQRVQQLELPLVLAGNLRLEWLEQLLSLQPTLLAVRGAVCGDSVVSKNNKTHRAGDLETSRIVVWLARMK
jgi:uncharacterized protein (UPF0264 family)